MRKYDIINTLNLKYGYKRFLEISTPTTGLTFGRVDPSNLEFCHRYTYNSVGYHDDGLPTTYRSTSVLSQQMLRAIGKAGSQRFPYDSVFIDPFHTYKSSAVDLSGAFALLEYGGALVIHDCSPTDPAISGDDFKQGAWCGVTYAAFIDFTMRRSNLSYYTVDCDQGCGVVFKRPPTANVNKFEERIRDQLSFEWEVVRDDGNARYKFFDENRNVLLKIISVAEFMDREGTR